MDLLGGRKFLAFLLLVAVGVGAEAYSTHGLSLNLVYLLLGLYGAFTASNVGITLGTIKSSVPSKDVQSPEPEEAEDVASQAPEEFQAPPAVEPAIQNVDHAAALARIEASLAQVVASIHPQNQALTFLTQAEQRRQMAKEFND